MLRVILDNNNLSVYRLEKKSHISHATLFDIYSEKTNIEKCSSSILHCLAQALKISMDKLYNLLSYNDLSLIAYDESFDLFKSNICHELKHIGSKEFIKKYLSNKDIDEYFDKRMYLEALYLLSIVDYLCVENKLPLASNYDNIRLFKLNKLYVSKSIYLLLKAKQIKISEIYKEAIPSFLKHNIVEANIYDIA